jgi:hypothetical protein
MSRRYVCYLLCFRDPQTGEPARYRHAGHYLGFAEAGRLDERVGEHRGGRGALLTAVVRQAGLDLKVTRTWDGGRLKERQLKTRSGALYCPDCSEHPLPGTRPRRAGAKYLTRRQRADRQREQPGERRLSLYELERMGTDLDGNPLPDPTDRVPAQAAHRKEPQMSGMKHPVSELGKDAHTWTPADERVQPDDEYEAEREAEIADPAFWGPDLFMDTDGQYDRSDPDAGSEPSGDAHVWRAFAPSADDPLPDTQTRFDLAVTAEMAARTHLRHASADMRMEAQERDRRPSPSAQLAVEQAQQHVRQAWQQQRAAQQDAYARAAELQEQAAAEPVAAAEPADRMPVAANARPPAAALASALPDGTPHADPRLAEHGWQARGGVYRRQAAGWQADREAG